MRDQLQHGVRATYVSQRCRCDACRWANTKYNKMREIRGVDLVDSEPARQHIAWLRSQGIGRLTIARRANVGKSVINRLAGTDKSRPAARIRPETLQRILSVTADRLEGGVQVDATGSMRRLQALIAIGYSSKELAERIGWTPQNITGLTNGHRGVTEHTRQLIDQLYQQLHMTPGPDDRARARAKRYGWLPPLAWDDIDTDNAAKAAKAAYPDGIVKGQAA